MGLSTLHISPLRGFSADRSVSEYYGEHRALLNGRDYEFLTEADGSGRAVGGKYVYVKPERELVLRVGGSLATVRTGLSGGAGGGLRGDVTGFSSASRRRLMRLIASLSRSERPTFVTLTYPDIVPAGPDKWKRDMDVFGKRAFRAYPEAGFIWRIEFKERKSGLGAGTIAPHFHLLVYGAMWRGLKAWCSSAWWEVVGTGDVNHRKAGSRVERVRSFGGIMRYVGKYIAKEDDYPSDWSGRVWGVIGRKNLPWAVEVVISLTDREAIQITRLGRKMIKARGRSFDYGLTWIVNAERVLDYLEFLSGFT